MQYYKLTITPKGQKPIVFEAGIAGRGLVIEFNVQTNGLETSNMDSYITIKNPPFEYIDNAQNFTDAEILLWGGMAKGLPLCRPEQQGVLLRGSVWGASGVWQGKESTLTFICYGLSNSVSSPAITGAIKGQDVPLRYNLEWKQGVELKDALLDCLKKNHPTSAIDIKIKTGLINGAPMPYRIMTLDALAKAVYEQTGSVLISVENGIILVRDGTVKSDKQKPVKIELSDIIGQPSIQDAAPKVVFSTVLRGDIPWMSRIILPERALTQIEKPAIRVVGSRNKFSGEWLVVGKTHIGAYRDLDGNNWRTIFRVIKS